MIGNKKEILNWLMDEPDDSFEIKHHKEKRSLNANSYAWVLIQKIADAVNSTKEDIYRKFIKEKGIFRTISINNDAVNTICHSWSSQGIGWLYDIINKGTITTDMVLYYGSSSYNTKQMATFIDYIVEEAKELKIETLTPGELEMLKKEWNN